MTKDNKEEYYNQSYIQQRSEDGKTDTMTEVSDSMEKQDDTVETSTEASVETTAPEGEGGGNEFVNEGESVEIKGTLFQNQY